jgi:hypothetical protein
MDLTASLQDVPISGEMLNLANRTADLDRSARAVEALVSRAGLSLADAEKTVRQMLNERHFYGSYCELGAYDWFDRHNASFSAQVQLSGHEVLNPNGCSIDGSFTHDHGYFDIKGMGFQAYVADKFKAALKKQLTGLDVTIEGPMDVSVKDIEAFAFPRLPALRLKLAGGGNEQIPELGWIVRAAPPKQVTITASTIDPYRLAEENRYYPFKTASQFTRNAPFILVFSYAAQFNHALFLNYDNGTDITLRAMARRAFMQLSTDTTYAAMFDNQVGPGATVGDAAKLLSGLLFINLDKDKSSLYLNPRATHRVSLSRVYQLFDFVPPPQLSVDDFAHDDY